MSSKKVAESQDRQSIGGSLVAISTIAGGVMLAVAFGFLNHLVRANAQRVWTDLIISELVFIDGELRSAGEGEEAEEIGEIRDAISSENRTRTLGTIDLEIRDGDRRLYSTDGMSTLVAQAAPFPHAASTIDDAAMVNWTDQDDRFFVLTSITVATPDQSRLIRLALDGSRTRDTLGAYRDASIGVVIVATLGFGLAVRVATQRAFRPLAEITHLAERIGVEHLEDRIGERRWPVELTRLAAAFDDMLDRLAASIHRLEQFSADIAHELRTPVSNIMGETEVTLRTPRSASEYRDTLASNLEEAERLQQIIASLLFLARGAASSERPVEWAAVDLRTELDSIASFFEPRSEEQRVCVNVRGSGSCTADRDLFRRAVVNLVSNALNATQAGGSITLGIVQCGDGAVAVQVRDTGSGIAPDDMPRIFDRFYRADRARSRREGSGLGLSIVQTIMQLHGGEVRVESELGKGSTFSLIFPARRGRSAHSSER